MAITPGGSVDFTTLRGVTTMPLSVSSFGGTADTVVVASGTNTNGVIIWFASCWTTGNMIQFGGSTGKRIMPSPETPLYGPLYVPAGEEVYAFASGNSTYLLYEVM